MESLFLLANYASNHAALLHRQVEQKGYEADFLQYCFQARLRKEIKLENNQFQNIVPKEIDVPLVFFPVRKPPKKQDMM